MKRLFTILATGLLALCAQAQMLVSTQFNTAQLPLQLTNLNGLFNAQFSLDSAGKTVIANGASLTNLIVRVTLTVPSGGTFQLGNDQYISGQILRNGDGTGDFEISSATMTVDGTLTAGGLAGPGSGITSIAAGNISSGTLAAGRLPALTGDVTTSVGSAATTIANSAVTYAKMQNVSATQRVLGRNTAGAGVAEEVTFSQFLDWVGSAAQGDILYRGASTWTRLPAGSSGNFLKTLGAGANPTWASIPGGGDALTSNPLSQFASTTSAQFFGVISDEDGNGPVLAAKDNTQTNVTIMDGLMVTNKGTGNFVQVTNGGITMSGGPAMVTILEGTAPSNPSANNQVIYADSTSHQISAKPSGGTVSVMVTPDTGASHNFLTGISSAGVPSKAQPAVADLSDTKTGSGNLVLATSPTLTTPTLGVATATSVNKWTLTAPTTAATLTAGADNLTYTMPSSSQTMVGRTSTDTLQNKTIETTSHGGNNTLKAKAYIQLKNFDNLTGAKPLNTNDFTVSTFMKPVFLNGTAATANFIQFQIQVPTDFDTSVDPKIKITDKLTAADTGVRRYIVSTISPAASAAYDGTVGTAINVDIAADASGASGDVEQSSQVTLTGWGAALTPGRHWVIQIGRDGNSGTDTSTVDSMFSVAEIEYAISQ